MMQTPWLERRVSALILSYADKVPIEVDAMAVTRLAASAAHRRWWLPRGDRGLVLIGVALLLIVVITAGAVAVGADPFRRDLERLLTSDAAVDPFIGLPPSGAAPSTPKAGTLMLSFYGGTGTGPRTRRWVFADGRMIWQQEANLPFGANDSSTGYVEQRLTTDGVELLRSAAVGSGLFDRDRVVYVGMGPCTNSIGVRTAIRFSTLTYSRACHGQTLEELPPDQYNSVLALDRKFGDLEGWLPSTAWEDATIKGFVPSQFVVCISTQTTAGDPLDSTRLLAALPVGATEALRDQEPAPLTGPWGLNVPIPDSSRCWTVTTKVARHVAAAFKADGYLQDPDRLRWGLEYHTVKD